MIYEIHILLDLSYMFRCVINHIQGEHRITCSKHLLFTLVLWCCVCYIVYPIEHTIQNIFIDLLRFFTLTKTIFCASYSVGSKP